MLYCKLVQRRCNLSCSTAPSADGSMAAEQRLNVTFAKFVEQFPCLYDPDDRNYNNRHVADKAWQEVAEEFKITVKQCKEKWKNIRTVFRRHLFGKPEGSSKKEYYMSEVLKYLIPVMRDGPKNLSDGLAMLQQHEEGQDNTVQISENENIQSEVSGVEDDDTTELPEISYSIPSLSIDSSTNSIARFRKAQLRKRMANSSLDDATIHYFKSKVKPSENKTINDDAEAQSDEHFLLSLKKDMKDMNARQKRTFKKRIFDLIDEVLDDNPVRTPDMYTPASGSSSVHN